jgi:hypothetical protein
MGIFDFFRKKPSQDQSNGEEEPGIGLPQLCYDIAYFILPNYIFHDLKKLTSLCQETPSAAGPFFYVMACNLREIEPDVEVARSLKLHTGSHADRPYLALEYPTPPDVDFDLAETDPAKLMDAARLIVLAPYWSVIFCDQKPEYFILGQSPLIGTTTVRQILPEGMNCNLGPGPKPTLPLFLEAISERRESP